MRNRLKILKIFSCFFIILSTVSLLAACDQPAPTVPATPTATTPAATATSAPANWWDKFGEPQYGDTLHLRVQMLMDSFDPLMMPWNAHYYSYETLFQADWTLDRDIFGFKIPGVPDQDYVVGNLVEEWEWQDDQTMILHLKQGVHWQNKEPTNGREFVAEDVAYHYDQVLGTGHGFTQPNPFVSGWCPAIERVTAQDKYTAVVKFKKPTPIANFWAIAGFATDAAMVPAELYETDPMDWHNATGTGAFMVSDFVEGSSLTYVKNPDYHGYDPRHPNNKLPYIDEVVIQCIPDDGTAMAALRTGKIDMLNDLDWRHGVTLQDSNPELMMNTRPENGWGLNPRIDQEPFSDIKVRKALQMAVNIPEIAHTVFGDQVTAEPVGLLSPELGEWCTPYADWPQELKDEYSYNPTKARELLAEAGYPNGFETTFHMGANEDPELPLILQAYFDDIGVKVDIHTIDATASLSFLMSGDYTGIAVWSFLGQVWPIESSIRNITSSGMNNVLHQNDATFDGYYQQYLDAKTIEEALEVVHTAEMYAVQQHWQVATTPRILYNVWQPYVGGYSGEVMTMIAWDRHMYWTKLWIDQSQK